MQLTTQLDRTAAAVQTTVVQGDKGNSKKYDSFYNKYKVSHIIVIFIYLF